MALLYDAVHIGNYPSSGGSARDDGLLRVRLSAALQRVCQPEPPRQDLERRHTGESSSNANQKSSGTGMSQEIRNLTVDGLNRVHRVLNHQDRHQAEDSAKDGVTGKTGIPGLPCLLRKEVPG